MNNFLEEIISPTTIKAMHSLGNNWDTFNLGLKQLLNFQFMMFDAMNDLAAKYRALQTEVNSISHQVFNIDEAVQAYFDRNPVQVMTRDGVNLDDALASVHEKLNTLSTHVTNTEESQTRLTSMIDDCVLKESFRAAMTEISSNTETTNAITSMVKGLQKDMKTQKEADDSKWELVREIVAAEVQKSAHTNEEKMIDELSMYVKHTELAQMTALFKGMSGDTRRARIPDIIPEIMADTSLTMEEKIRKAHEALSSERTRLNTEEFQLEESYNSLKELTLSMSTDRDDPFGPTSVDTEIRDVGTDSGYTEPGETRTAAVLKKGKRDSVGTNFNGPDNCTSEREQSLDNLMSAAESSRMPTRRGGQVEVDTNEITANVVMQCQGIIERQLELVLNALGVKIERNDIVTLVQQLKIVEEMEREMKNIKVKLPLKVDQSLFVDELKKYLKREDFFAKCAEVGLDIQDSQCASMSSLPKVVTRGSARPATPGLRKKQTERKGPVPLVPARNPAMMGVNDKYLRGRDNKLYLRETSQLSDRSYKEPNITGTSKSYYDRSKMTMEIDGVDAVFDFQPFVPSDNPRASTSMERVRVETYDFDGK